MVHATSFLLVLSLAMVAPVLSTKKLTPALCVLAGNWTNDLGSNMTINPMDSKCNFDGTYLTAVAESKNKIKKSPLRGSQNCTDKTQPVFGFTVNWSFSDSITVFTGQCFVDKGKEVLKTMWLLRSHQNSIKDYWNATKVGTNVFTRQSPQKE
ncbi:AVID protein, partial [Amazona guildingii]|nr:AVID protein [Amazona guildingii]